MTKEMIIIISLASVCGIAIIVNIVQAILHRKQTKKVAETISAYIASRNEEEEQRNLPAPIEESEIPLSERIATTQAFMEFIETQVKLRIISERRWEIFLKTKNKNLDVDKVIQEVSTDIWKSIHENVKKSSTLIVSEDFLMKFVTDTVTTTYLIYINENVADQL